MTTTVSGALPTALPKAAATHRVMRAVQTVGLVPRNLVIIVLRAYRAIISPLYGDVCRYYPSCSAYALGSVQEHGVSKGGVLAVRRLARCHPWAEGGIDDWPLREDSPYRRTRWGLIVLDRKA